MKKKLLSLLLAAAVVLSMPMALFAAEATPADTPASLEAADENIGIAPASVSTFDMGASRKSSTSGSVSAYASFNTKASKATCTITLQEKYNGSWRTATDIPVKSYSKTVYNSYSISASKTFTLKSGKVYRARIVVTDTNTSGNNSKTFYTGAF